jgi:lipoyl(octanoyl) transferase
MHNVLQGLPPMAATEIPGRLLIEGEPRDGCWNMAYDEALLDAAANRGETILRIYRWSEPTLSLGYFQKTLPHDLPEPLRSLPRVRRLSGGGAILHHHEWTYACAVPRAHLLARRAEALYEEAHRALIDSFAEYGIGAALRGSPIENSGETGFLCFLRGDPRDVVVQGHKIVGSAQRRRRGAVLQHGSVLLRRSPLVRDVPGLFDLAPRLTQDPLLCAREFASAFGRRLFGTMVLTVQNPEDELFAGGRVVNYADC